IPFFWRTGEEPLFLEIEHDRRSALDLPAFEGLVEFVLGTGSFALNGRTKSFPEDAEEDIALWDTQYFVDEALWSSMIKARICVAFPPGYAKYKSHLLAKATIEFVCDMLSDVALGFDVARRS